VSLDYRRARSSGEFVIKELLISCHSCSITTSRADTAAGLE
jgi:hypothetical protein